LGLLFERRSLRLHAVFFANSLVLNRVALAAWDDMTTECLVTIPNQLGLHLRAAATLAKRAAQFDCVIHIGNGAKSVEATSTIGLVTLGVAQFGQVTVKAEGHDADAAVLAIRQLVDACFESGE